MLGNTSTRSVRCAHEQPRPVNGVPLIARTAHATGLLLCYCLFLKGKL